MSIWAKICGIQDKKGMTASIEGGADAVGFVFIKDSPNYVDPKVAAELAKLAKGALRKPGLVGVFENLTNEEILEITRTVGLTMIQLHGEETSERVREIRELTKGRVSIVRALTVKTKKELRDAVRCFGDCVDYLLFDSRSGDRYKSGGIANWSLFDGEEISVPWILAGGLNAGNLRQAVHATGVERVDVSSGVDKPPPYKDPDRIKEFLAVAESIDPRMVRAGRPAARPAHHSAVYAERKRRAPGRG